MHKFFVDESNIHKDSICIVGENVNHIVKVLRMKNGDKILVSNGRGKEYICSLSNLSTKEVICDIIYEMENKTEPPVSITLFQGLPKAQKMDLIVQKCVEIGVSKIQPVITSRVVVKTEGKDITGKLERWQRIAEEAAKQSNRGTIPKIFKPISFDKSIEMLGNMDLTIVPYEREESLGIKNVLKNGMTYKDIGIFIGPEGGFEEYEIERCLKAGIKPVTLGPRILRTETAGFVASTMILYEIGDMGGKG